MNNITMADIDQNRKPVPPGATKQQIAEVPPGLGWCRDSALKLISRSGPEDFDDYVTWANWCRSVAGAGLMQDPARLERLAKEAGRALPPSAGQRYENDYN